MLAPINQALAELAQGRMIVVVDDEDRENEGDLVCLANTITPAHIAFMAVHGRGLICLALDHQLCDHLNLANGRAQSLRDGDSIHSLNRSRAWGDHRDFGGRPCPHHCSGRRPTEYCARHRQPGARLSVAGAGGVLERPGHTEAAVDFARLLNRRPAGVICEIMNDDGSMARRPQLELFCQRHHLVMTSVAQLVEYRRQTALLTPHTDPSFVYGR